MQNEELVLLSLGGNRGDWKGVFQEALSQLAKLGTIDKKSAIYETEPWGRTDQPRFKNMVVGMLTGLDPMELLGELLQIEQSQGRDRDKEERWGERTLDLDILLFGNSHYSTEDLDIPHPRMHERAFVLVPALEIYPDVIIPGTGRSIESWLSDCSTAEINGVKFFADAL